MADIAITAPIGRCSAGSVDVACSGSSHEGLAVEVSVAPNVSVLTLAAAPLPQGGAGHGAVVIGAVGTTRQSAASIWTMVETSTHKASRFFTMRHPASSSSGVHSLQGPTAQATTTRRRAGGVTRALKTGRKIQRSRLVPCSIGSSIERKAMSRSLCSNPCSTFMPRMVSSITSASWGNWSNGSFSSTVCDSTGSGNCTPKSTATAVVCPCVELRIWEGGIGTEFSSASKALLVRAPEASSLSDATLRSSVTRVSAKFKITRCSNPPPNTCKRASRDNSVAKDAVEWSVRTWSPTKMTIAA